MDKENLVNDKPRLKWLDIMKGILISFVMLDHSVPDAMTARFYAPFFLVMFFWVGGYTFSMKDSFKSFIISKIRHLVIPLFVLGILRILIISIMFDFSIFWDRVLGLILQRSFVLDDMWFLSCLFMAELIMYFVVKAVSKINSEENRYAVLLLIELILMGIGYVIIEFIGVKFIWEFENALIMVFFTGCGYVWRRSEEKAKKLLRLPVVLSFFVIYIILWILMPNDVNIHIQKLANFPLFLLEALLMMPVIIYLGRKLEGCFLGKVFSLLGVNTLFFFAFGGFGREVFNRSLSALGIELGQWGPFLCAIFILCLMTGPAILFKKFFPFAVGVTKKKK